MARSILWCTDIHLDFLRPGGPKSFGEYLKAEYPSSDAIVLSGDLANTRSLKNDLQGFEEGCGKPVYFVLGNHDYYHGSFEVTESIANKFSGWLEKHQCVELTSSTALVGVEGWYDGMCGFPYQKKFRMSDWDLIKDLLCVVDRDHLLSVCRTRSESMASMAKAKISKAFQTYKTVVFVTHYPPFHESSWHQGALGDDLHAPWFTSILMGKALYEVAEKHPDNKLLVLCGHTHSSGIYDPLSNLKVLTGEALYNHPDVAGVITVKNADCSINMRVNNHAFETTF